MKALILEGNAKAHVEEVPDPVPGPGELLVSMRCSGICGSDLVYYHAPPEFLQRFGGNRIPCHEPSGVVIGLGHGVRGFQEGDRVTLYHYVGCGKCRECRRGHVQWCPEKKGMGGAYQGSAADRMVVPERNAIRLPDSLSFVDGAFVACGAATTFSALHKVTPSGTDTLAVFGLGPVGLCGVAFGKAMGAKVIAIGRRAPRLRLAREFGADAVIDIDAGKEVPRTIRELCPGGPNKVYETSSNPQARQWALRTCARGAEIVSVGAREEAGWSAGALVGKEITLRGSFVIPVWMVFDLIPFLVDKGIHLETMVTHRFPIDRAAEAFELFNGKECGKVTIEWED